MKQIACALFVVAALGCKKSDKATTTTARKRRERDDASARERVR
jgi:hypothetical protein